MSDSAADATELPQSDATVRDKTGRGWDEWFALLDARGAERLAHAEIVRLLASLDEGVTPWWRQTLVVGYERARGLREKNQASSGFQLSASRTLPVPLEALYAAWAEPEARGRWLPDDALVVRTATPGRVVRGECPDGSRVEAYFYGKGEGRSQVSVSQTRLADAEAVARGRTEWKARLDRLAALLAGGNGGP